LKQLTPIARTLQQLASGQVTSSGLVNACLTAIADPNGEGARTYTRVSADKARKAAAAFDAAFSKQATPPHTQSGPLAGLPISIKDLLDIAGEPTPAGSKVLANAAPALADAPVVHRLRRAGAIILGRTNMTEFAFSGLGLNPHYGTPRNPYDRPAANNKAGRISGGSSSGAAISVTDNMAHAAIGSDTGGSIRIPAALCGLSGFKPTARRIPLEGAVPLSPTLDSLGPIAPTVSCCALIDAVLADETPQPLTPPKLSTLRFAVLQGYVLDALEPAVAKAYASSLSLLSERGAQLIDFHFASLDKIPASMSKCTIATAECYPWHRRLLTSRPDEDLASQYDPHVLSRILRGADSFTADYLDLLYTRQQIIADATTAFAGFDAILMPTVPHIAPLIADIESSDDAYFHANGLILRNPGVINFIDGCSLSIPCHFPGEAPVGLMISGLANADKNILNIGAAIEAALADAGRAIHLQPNYSTTSA
jgi:aspartyl-tRNA(Asn)/glutamyl-tRNA(Gln) amidotransferase subunit A